MSMRTGMRWLGLCAAVAAAGCGAGGESKQAGGGSGGGSGGGGGGSSAGQDGGGGSGGGGSGDPGGSGLSPSGAQDFGRFKAVLDSGKIPGPDTLDQVGFFAEHKIGEPPTACEGPVCARADMGSMGNMITGSNCTLVHLALGTPLEAGSLPRPGLDVAVVVDTGAKLVASPSALGDLLAGIGKLLDGIEDGDTVTVVTAGPAAEALADRAPGSDREVVRSRLGRIAPTLSTNLYDGIRLAVDSLGGPASGRSRRLVLATAGVADTGITSPDRIVRLVRAFAEGAGGVTVVSLGAADSGVRLSQAIADLGAGALYFVSSSGELPGLFEREVGVSLLPVAEKVRIRVDAGRSWRLREVFGVKGWSLDAAGGTIDIPALQLAWRKMVSGGGSTEARRGGGGAILIEVLPRLDADKTEMPSPVTDIEVGYVVPGTTDFRAVKLPVISPTPPGVVPVDGYFASGSVEKGFVTLNIYVAFRLGAGRATAGDLRGAYDVLAAVNKRAGEWLVTHPDTEIKDDLKYVGIFLGLLAEKGALMQPPRSGYFNEPWPRD